MAEIKTTRLILRSLRKTDAINIVKNLNNLNVSKWLLVVPYPYRMKDVLWWINKNLKSSKKIKDSYEFGIILNSTKECIGEIGISHISQFQGTAIISYWIGQKYWRQGYGSEVLKAIIGFAFTKLKLRRLEARVFEGNPSSGKLLRKFKFKLEGVTRESARSKANRKIYNEQIYGLLKEGHKKWQA
ncbi:GNAT family N-acetyltransferase [Candidatus Pacearchaeota archaeon]|nr:GNAT family N-acetyltransferase [Candidatus Pacearchaeota archaeon]